MWGKMMIPMYRLWLHGLYGLYGPRCPLSPERLLNLITHSLLTVWYIGAIILKKEIHICYLAPFIWLLLWLIIPKVPICFSVSVSIEMDVSQWSVLLHSKYTNTPTLDIVYALLQIIYIYIWLSARLWYLPSPFIRINLSDVGAGIFRENQGPDSI